MIYFNCLDSVLSWFCEIPWPASTGSVTFLVKRRWLCLVCVVLVPTKDHGSRYLEASIGWHFVDLLDPLSTARLICLCSRICNGGEWPIVSNLVSKCKDNGVLSCYLRGKRVHHIDFLTTRWNFSCHSLWVCSEIHCLTKLYCHNHYWPETHHPAFFCVCSPHKLHCLSKIQSMGPQIRFPFLFLDHSSLKNGQLCQRSAKDCFGSHWTWLHIPNASLLRWIRFQWRIIPRL